MSEHSDINKALRQTLSEDDFNSSAVRKLAATLSDEQLHAQERGEDVESILLETLADEADERSHLDEETKATVGLDETQSQLSDRTFSYQQEAEATLNKNLPGRYIISSILHSSAIGQQFSVYDNNLERQIAVNFLKPKYNEDDVKVEQFVREARLSARLTHPNIPPVYDFDFTEGGLIYYTTNCPVGRSLEDILQNAQRTGVVPETIRSFNDRVRIIQRVCHALTHAHSKGLIHQDIKPGNIMLGDCGEVTLNNWGNASEDQVDSECVIGTPLYMAPEQARREGSSHLTDIYAVGATFFHLLTLRYPCWNEDLEQFWEAKKSGTYQAATAEETQRIPAALLAIATKAMAAQTQDRYQLASDIQEDLNTYQEQTASIHHTTRPRSYFASFCLVGCTLLLCLGTLTYSMWKGFLPFNVEQHSSNMWKKVSLHNWALSTLSDLDTDWELYSSTEPTHLIALSQATDVSLKDGILQTKSPLSEKTTLELRSKRPQSGALRVQWEQKLNANTDKLQFFIGGQNGHQSYRYVISNSSGNKHGSVRLYREQTLMDEQQLLLHIHFENFVTVLLEKDTHSLRLTLNEEPIHHYVDPDFLDGTNLQQFGFVIEDSAILTVRNIHLQRKAPAFTQGPDAIANDYYSNYLYADALPHFQELLRNYSQAAIRAPALYRSARCWSAQTQYNEAATNYLQFLQAYPQHPLAANTAYEYILTLAKKADWNACNAALRNYQQLITSSAQRQSLALNLRSLTANAKSDAAELQQINQSIFLFFSKALESL